MISFQHPHPMNASLQTVNAPDNAWMAQEDWEDPNR